MFQLISISKSYGGRFVLKDLTLVIPPNKTTAVIGPSGSGKSTVLSVMTGLLKPDKGTVSFAGELVVAGGFRPIRQKLGYVIQDGGLFPHLTGSGNVSLMANYLGWTTAAVDSRLKALAELVRLPSELLGRYPAEMSGGQRQRVSLMRALMLDPDVLLLDEPFGALDAMVRADLRDDLTGIFRKLGKTVVLVTHDLQEAAFFADQIVLMKDGQIVQIGSEKDLVEHPVDPFVWRFVNAQHNRSTERHSS